MRQNENKLIDNLELIPLLQERNNDVIWSGDRIRNDMKQPAKNAMKTRQTAHGQ